MENLYSNKNVISIVATKSGMGKTTLIEKLIKIFKSKKYKVGVLKHDAHKFEMDKKGKDTYKFSEAGADNVIISSSKKMAMIKQLEEEKDIEDILKYFDDVDLVIIEGFKNNSYPKIEVHRKNMDENMLYTTDDFDKSKFLAIASDENLMLDVKVLDLNDANSIANFIEDNIIKNRG